MTEDQVMDYIRNARDERGLNAFRLGGGLARLEINDCTGGHPTPRQFVEKELGMRWNDAKVKMTVYKTVVGSDLTAQHLGGLPWSKVVIIAPILTAENCQEWIAKAKKTTHGELRVMVEAHKIAGAGNGYGNDKPKTDVQSMTFKLHPDQKEQVYTALDKAKAEMSTDFDNVALEAICTGCLAGTVQAPKAKPTLKQLMEESTPEEILTTFEQVFPHINITVEELADAVADTDEGEEVV